MDSSIVVRAFAPDEWRLYRDLRLRSLAESPDAFGSTLAAEAQRPEAEWERRLAAAAGSGRDFPAVVVVNGQPAGLAWGRIDPARPDTASLYQVWVAPEYRGRGAGAALMRAFIAWAAAQRVRYLELGVTWADSPAVRLYRRAGFEPVGEPQPLRPGAALLGQMMRLSLEPGA